MAKITVSFTLDSERDRRIVRYLEGLARGEKSEAIRAALAAHVSGAGVSLQPDYQWSQGTMMVAINVEAFRPLDAFRQMVADFGKRIKLTPRAKGCDEILMPGEPEWRCKEKREQEGIPVPEKTWDRLSETAESLGLVWNSQDPI